MLKKIAKCCGLHLLRSMGLFRLVRQSRWRSERLLILAYHGISLDDEHLWNRDLYFTAEGFERRLALLKRGGYNVLPLAFAVEALYRGELPEKSVVITVDDGNYDFYAKAFPLLQRYGYPATVYLTTSYCECESPVFPNICAYLLWKRRGAVIPAPGLTDQISELDLRSTKSRAKAYDSLRLYAEERKLSVQQKNELAERLAAVLSIDYSELCAKRLLQRMNAGEVAEVAAAGIDVQLHTHRHDVPEDRALFCEEIAENRRQIVAMTGQPASHFCYPSGVYKQEFLPWLAESGVVSATTCIAGMASAGADPLLLPRLLDGSYLTPVEFEGWASGASALMRRRARPVRVRQAMLQAQS